MSELWSSASSPEKLYLVCAVIGGAMFLVRLAMQFIGAADSGDGSEKGSSTANFVSSLIKSLPPIHDVAGMAGVELPGYLGKMVEDVRGEKPPAGASPKRKA